MGSRANKRQNERHLFWKTVVTSLVVILTNVIANYGLSRGLHDIGTITSWSPIPYVSAFAHCLGIGRGVVHDRVVRIAIDIAELG